MARPREVEKGIQLSLWIDEKTLKDLDRISRKIGLSRSRFARNLINVGLQDAKMMDAIGLFKLMRKAEGWKEDVEAIENMVEA